MPDKKFKLSGPEAYTIAEQTVDKLLRAGDGDAALLYLYMLKTHDQSTPNEAAATMGKSVGWAASAMAVLSRIGLIKSDDESAQPQQAMPAQTPRRYTAEEIKQVIDTRPDFSALVDEAQRSLGKILSPEELERLLGIYDALQMPAEVIMLLITHCITESRKKGGGRMPSVRYIENTAYTWEREGIFTLDSAEEYLKALEARRSAQGEIKAALQIRDRELSTPEKQYVDAWIAMGFGPDAVEIAYERTVMNIGKPAMGYINAIINNWHGKGLHQPQEILEKDVKSERYAPRKDKKDSKQKYGEPNHEEIKRMERILEKVKQN